MIMQDISRFRPGHDKSAALLTKLETAAEAGVQAMRQDLRAFLRVVEQEPDREVYAPLLEAFAGRFEHLVLVGTGGSSLGAKALAALVGPGAPQFHTLENVDLHTTQSVLDAIVPEKTLCLLISKSGNTVEVLANAHVLIAHFSKRLGPQALPRHFVVITEPNPSPLGDVAEVLNLRALPHNPAIGGRYSVFSLVGQCPAALLGLDVEAFRAGAAATLRRTLEEGARSDAAAGAILQIYHMMHGKPIHVLMPYCDRLRILAYWYRQLVAESLGKDHTGITPLASFGAVDQHSMLQLYNDGQADKQYSFILLDQAGQGQPIEPIDGAASLLHLMGKKMGDVMMAMHHGTIESVANHGHPLRVLTLEALNEQAMGALMMHFALETVISGAVMDIDPFNQPAVEESKRLARAYLESKKG